MDSLRRFFEWSRPYWLGAGIGLVIVVALGTAWAIILSRSAQEQTERITRIVQGTPGPEGEPGIGIRRVSIVEIASGQEPFARLRFPGQVTLFLPAAEAGPQGPRGLRGHDATGPPGPRGPRGPQGPPGARGRQGTIPMARIVAAVGIYLRSHELICTRTGPQTLTCKVR